MHIYNFAGGSQSIVDLQQWDTQKKKTNIKYFSGRLKSISTRLSRRIPNEKYFFLSNKLNASDGFLTVLSQSPVEATTARL